AGSGLCPSWRSMWRSWNAASLRKRASLVAGSGTTWRAPGCVLDSRSRRRRGPERGEHNIAAPPVPDNLGRRARVQPGHVGGQRGVQLVVRRQGGGKPADPKICERIPQGGAPLAGPLGRQDPEEDPLGGIR